MTLIATRDRVEGSVRRASVPGDELAAGAARRFLRATLAEWAGLGPPQDAAFAERVLDDAALVISELVTNAVVHAGTAVDILCRLDAEVWPPSGLVIEVADRHPGRVLRGSAEQHPDEREGGRGLHLVAALSDTWGVTYQRDRKTVWCRLDLTGAAAASAAAEAAARSATGAPAPHPADGGDRRPLLAPVPPEERPRRADGEWISRGSLTFLAEASDLLAGQLDEDHVASLATQLLVPRLADWCAVWLYPAGAAPRLAHVWHSVEQWIDPLRALLDKSPPTPTPRPGARSLPWPVMPCAPTERGGSLAVPLVAAGHCHGTLLLGRTGALGIPAEATGLIEDFARRVALAMGTARQYARQAMISTVLQRGLLPPATGRIPGVEHAVVYEPMAGDWVGGDFYDLFPTGDGRWCFALGDVCGSGPEAASLTGIVRPVLRLLAREGYGVSDVLDRLNKALADEAAAALIGETAAWEGGQARFLSLLYGEITPYAPGRGARCTLASAGHPLPLVLGPDGRVRPAATPQMLLGISDDARYDSESFLLAPGDTLLCVTDGVTERRRGRRQFDDDDGLAAALSGCVTLGAAGVAERIRRAVHDYDAAPPADDLALLVLQAR
ncbi:SpoIIE family protein phosphatase [Actinacidiphila sp. ITFR-21]|uniref:SpoIIE family protein phosphatase n=1 Tax=Actinacidiphila sp. ITFR-21 TaxID=3075199 RepID=UPI00288B4CB8|nr:SpoIIE family protein phosphatase [Streptomyces sp. ITFR-21]WNI15446.1 SpoIIE family protein phosphatase [Streptomyces sp. ITFR-21]